MKKNLKILPLVVFAMSSSLLFAQEQVESYHTPKWIPDKGYWIIESKINSPDTAIIHFYNNDNVQVYFEKLEGVKLNLKRRKTLMGLKKVLDEALMGWRKSPDSTENAQLVRSLFRPREKSW